MKIGVILSNEDLSYGLEKIDGKSFIERIIDNFNITKNPLSHDNGFF